MIEDFTARGTRAVIYEIPLPTMGDAGSPEKCPGHPGDRRIRLEVSWVGVSEGAIAEYAYHFDVCALCHRKLQEGVDA